LLQFGRDFDHRCGRLNWRFCRAGADPLVLPYPQLRGTFQLSNASAAIAALGQLRDRLPVSERALRNGLVNASVAGRFQVLREQPTVIADVAHNPHAAAALARNLERSAGGGRTVAVFAMLADKDIDGVVAALKDHIDEWLVADIRELRGATAAHLAGTLRAQGVGECIGQFERPALAYRHALERVGAARDRIIVFGSFYTVADVLREEASTPTFGRTAIEESASRAERATQSVLAV
jgi:dihydrofolate synthase/folylpolyglutamate synthase